jgi:hypothetical protein
MMRLEEILNKFKENEISLERTRELIDKLFSNIRIIDDKARLDLFRERRLKIPEVIFAEGKRPDEVSRFLIEMTSENNRAMATRVERETYLFIKKEVPPDFELSYYEIARMVVLAKEKSKPKEFGGKVGLISGGTSDLPIAEEARITAIEFGCRVLHAYDVGVAGVHRLFPPLQEMLKEDVDVMIVVAGMEGTLPTLVKSLIDIPVIAVPTSIGYGVGVGGKAALNTMLQSCAPGLAVVNIDNGFGAASVAALIANRVAKFREKK